MLIHVSTNKASGTYRMHVEHSTGGTKVSTPSWKKLERAKMREAVVWEANQVAAERLAVRQARPAQVKRG